ncbi:MAG: response regulator transcription factor [Myxococcales bacterium]|nr:response regulator transcription factor [Myxococcales bacterium]
MAHVLLVDDDRELLDVLSLAMTEAGHEVDVAPDGAAGLERIAARAPAVLVTDVNMPRLDGFALCKRLRDEGRTFPIVILTSRDTEIDEALGLELGADDYVTKPFSTRVLLARISALLRRDVLRAAAEPAAETVRAGELELDIGRIEARYRTVEITLTLTEFRLLEALARRPGIVMGRERLLELARGDDSVVTDRVIDTYVRRLRRKLESIDPTFASIETVVGAGYRWSAGR